MKKLTILVVAALLCVFALPAFAQDKADWAFYGSIRFWTEWESWDKEAPTSLDFGSPSTKRSGNYVSGTNRFDDSDLWWGMQYNARIGANVKWGNVSGRVEWGHQSVEGSATNADTAHVRLLYADWNFGPGVLRVGQDYTPYFFLISNMCGPAGGDCSGIGFGSLYAGRKDQIKLTFGGFQVALVEPQVTTTGLRPSVFAQNTTTFAVVNTTLPNDTDRSIPKIEASYTFNLGPAALFIGGGYNTYDAVYVVNNAEKSISVDSWGLGIGGKVPIGPFYVNAAFQYLRNPGNFGFGQNAPVALAGLTGGGDPAVVGDTADITVWSGALVVGFNLTNTLSFEGGVLYLNGSGDTNAGLTGTSLPYGLGVEYDFWDYYITMTWSPAKNVFIQPEIGFIDFGKAKVDTQADDDLGNLWYVGIKWMINF
jgi:hypothetical protein